jgi:hypothetical protein
LQTLTDQLFEILITKIQGVRDKIQNQS